MSETAGQGGFSALRAPYVVRFTLGRASATLAVQFVAVAVAWELYERTNDPWSLGLIGAVQVAPALALALPSGALADRVARRDVALLAHLLLVVFTLGLALVSWRAAAVELVYALLALSAMARVLAAPSAQTILVQILDRRQFANAQAWQVSCSKLAQVVGPVLAGLLIAGSGGATAVYLAAAVGQLAFVGVLASMPRVPSDPAAGSSGLAGLLAGARFIRRTPLFLAAISLDLFAIILGGAVALLPIFARDILEAGPTGLGLLRGSPALGAMAAALLATRLPPWQRPGRVLLITVAGFGLATIGFGLSRSLLLSLACLFLIGAFDAVSIVIRTTLQQVITPNALMGRVAAANGLCITMSNELGALESGAVAALFGPVVSVVSGGLGTLAVVGLVHALAPGLARLGPLHTLAPAEETAAAARAWAGAPLAEARVDARGRRQ